MKNTLLTALLGIGSGVLKIPAMDTALRLPIKVSSATSNFMIGVTAFGIFFTPTFYVLLRAMAGNRPLTQHGEATVDQAVKQIADAAQAAQQ